MVTMETTYYIYGKPIVFDHTHVFHKENINMCLVFIRSVGVHTQNHWA